MSSPASLRSCLALGSLLLLLGQVPGAPQAPAVAMPQCSQQYYDRYTQTCQEFTYGGCQGNANNFRSLESCEKSCWMIRRSKKPNIKKSRNKLPETTRKLEKKI
ncbi:unnamed protein product [Eretmochelys imbricata]